MKQHFVADSVQSQKNHSGGTISIERASSFALLIAKGCIVFPFL